MPPRLMTATSVVPPPMSTMRLPDGSLTGSPAPIAAAIGSSMRRAQRAPALSAASRTARFSTSVTPDGMPSSIRGRGDQPDPVVDLVHEVLDHLLGHVEVADDAVAQRPDRDDVGRRPADHPLGLGADRQDPPGLGVDRHDRRLAHDDAAVADVDQRVGGPEVDPDVAGEEAEDPVEHGRRARPSWRSGQVAARRTADARRVARDRAHGSGRARAVYPVAPGPPAHGPRLAALAARIPRRHASRGGAPGRSNATPRSRSET